MYQHPLAREHLSFRTRAGRPENSQSRHVGTALRSAGVLACELWHRPGALLKIEMLSTFARKCSTAPDRRASLAKYIYKPPIPAVSGVSNSTFRRTLVFIRQIMRRNVERFANIPIPVVSNTAARGSLLCLGFRPAVYKLTKPCLKLPKSRRFCRRSAATRKARRKSCCHWPHQRGDLLSKKSHLFWRNWSPFVA